MKKSKFLYNLHYASNFIFISKNFRVSIWLWQNKIFSPMNLRNKGESSAATGASSFLYSLLWIVLHECIRVPAGRSFPFSLKLHTWLSPIKTNRGQWPFRFVKSSCKSNNWYIYLQGVNIVYILCVYIYTFISIIIVVITIQYYLSINRCMIRIVRYLKFFIFSII